MRRQERVYMQVKTVKDKEYCIIELNKKDTEAMALLSSAKKSQEGVVSLVKYLSYEFPEVAQIVGDFHGTEVPIGISQSSKGTQKLIIAKDLAVLNQVTRPRYCIEVEFLQIKDGMAAYIFLPAGTKSQETFDECFINNGNLEAVFNNFLSSLGDEVKKNIDSICQAGEELRLLVNRKESGYEFIMAKGTETAMLAAQQKGISINMTFNFND